MAVEKKIKYKDQRLTKDQQKKVKPANQGGGPNYLGKEKTVTVPKKWLSSPDHVVAELAYITPREQKILLDANLYGSLKGKPNKGPGGIMSLQGDLGGYDASPGGPNDGTSDGPVGRGPDKNKQRAADIMTGKTNVSSPTGDTVGYGNKPSIFSNIVGGIKDYVMGGGIIGAGIRGLTGLYDKVTGPPDLGIRDGYNMANIAGPKSYDFGPGPGEGNDNQGIMAAYNPYILPVEGEGEGEGEEAPVSQEEEDFIQRYRVANEFRQDKQGQLDPAILEMISKLYT
jgi:hypothetical protein